MPAETPVDISCYQPLRRTGTCRNGAERDAGHLTHAVAGGVPNGGSWKKALCGVEPGRRSSGWSDIAEEVVSCPRCLKKLEKIDPEAGKLLGGVEDITGRTVRFWKQTWTVVEKNYLGDWDVEQYVEREGVPIRRMTCVSPVVLPKLHPHYVELVD